MSEHLLELRQVEHSYNGRPVLSIPQLGIRRGTITGLAGPNGSGKSTLLNILALTTTCSKGEVLFNGRRVTPFSGDSRQRITLLPQVPYLLRRSVRENIDYGLKVRGETGNMVEAVYRALELVGLPTDFAGRQWHELSGGEAQRVALAARLVLRPACLLLDEPTASVDMESARLIRRAVLLARKEWQTTLVIASHQQLWLNDICDEMVHIFNGRILGFGSENILFGPWQRESDNLASCRLADGQLLYVSSPSHPNSCGVFAPDAFAVIIADDRSGEFMLRGTVTGIFLDGLNATPRVHVLCGDHRFVVDSPPEISCLPGREIHLRYNPAAITWLPG